MTSSMSLQPLSFVVVSVVVAIVAITIGSASPASAVSTYASSLPPPPTQQTLIRVSGRTDFSVVLANNSVFVLGGFSEEDGQAVDTVEVFGMDGTPYNYNGAPMPTARGLMAAVLLNETLIVTIGGSSNASSGMPLPTVEAFDIVTGEWTIWQGLEVARVNATATVSFGGIVVALGVAEGSENDETTEFIDPIGNSTFLLSNLKYCEGEGVLGTLSSNIAAFFCNINGDLITYVLKEYGGQWDLLRETPLVPWTVLSIRSISSSSSFYLASTLEHNSLLLFTLSEGYISQYMCYTGAMACNDGVLQYTDTAWICVSSSSNTTEKESSSADGRATTTTTTQQSRSCSSEPVEGWQTYRGNAQHTGQSNSSWSCYPSYAAEKAIKWTLEFNGTVLFSPIVDLEGRVYVYGNNSIFAIYGTNNTVIWSTPIPLGGNTYSAVINGDVLYITGYMAIYALSRLDGSMMWNAPLPSPSVYSTPIVGTDGLTLFVGTLYSGILVFTSTGTQVGSPPISNGVLMSTPAIDQNGTIYMGSSSNPGFYSYNYATKANLSTTFSLSTFSSPAIGSDGSIFQGCMNSFLFRWIPKTKSLATKQLNGMILSSPAISQYGIVYVLTSYGTLFALTCDTMDILWSTSLTTIKAEHLSSPAIGIDDTVYVAAGTSVFAIDGQSGIVKWNYTITGSYLILSSPAIGIDGTVFIGAGPYLYAFHGDLAEDQWVTSPL